MSLVASVANLLYRSACPSLIGVCLCVYARFLAGSSFTIDTHDFLACCVLAGDAYSAPCHAIVVVCVTFVLGVLFPLLGIAHSSGVNGVPSCRTRV